MNKKHVHPLCRLHAVLCSIISLLKTVSYPFALSGINIGPNWHWYYTVLVIAYQVLTDSDSEPSVTVRWINMHCSYDYTMCICVCVHWVLNTSSFGYQSVTSATFFTENKKYVLSMIEMVKKVNNISWNFGFFSWNPTLARIWPEVDTFRMSLCEVSSGSPSLSDDSSPASAWGSGEVRDSWGSRT